MSEVLDPEMDSTPESFEPKEDAKLQRFFADRGRMWRNLIWVTFGHFGMALSMTIVEPLMNLRLKAIGVSDSSIGLLTSANLWAVSFLVMYYSWKSDHCTSKLGRRTPFVLGALPFLTLSLLLFPLSDTKWVLIALMGMYFFFNDVKASTYPLLAIDCVSKDLLARASGLVAVMTSLAGFLSSRVGARMADAHPGRVFVVAAMANAVATLLALWQIKEPPIYHPTKERFNFLAPIRVAAQDKRILVLMIAVALLNAFPAVFKTWVWFYAKSKLGLTIGQTGAAMSWGLLLQIGISYPAGWFIDRWGSYLALLIVWLLMLGLSAFSVGVHTASGLIMLTVFYALIMALKVAGDTILWKTMDKADTGSYTSTVALCRNFCTGTVIAISGFLIKWTGSYVAAFWFGFVLSTIALFVFFIYRHLMRAGGGPSGVIADRNDKDGGLAESALPA
ncbi:MFS transporter [Terriglobus roseus]|uniref:Predicted arabinose efflux permease, MFS family n=1 Tax=Terriglobus roseus TaxID=392734 RepID=A0A1H4JU62_9BACT|nr:MFS transporter [Terriglobus roseus]SEB49841.1 Predicted arabinose efflux permease, MFS family [Terriglobus roseus]